MNGLPYYKAYPRDFVEGTIGMPFEIKCAYRVVIDLIYMQGGQLPDDARYISGLLGCSLRKWKVIRSDLIERGKLEVSGEFLTNKRADKELETLSKLQDKQAENARGAKKNKDLEKPRRNHTEPEPDIRETNVSLAREAKRRRFSKTALPDDWVPDLAKAQSLMAELDLTRDEMNYCYQQMKGHAHATDRRLANWDQGFGNWVRKAVKDGDVGPSSRSRRNRVNGSAFDF